MANRKGRKTQNYQPRTVKIRRVMELTGEGWKPPEIAHEMKIHERTVWDYLKRGQDIPEDTPEFEAPDPKNPSDITDPDVLPVLQDTPEGFRYFVHRYSKYTPFQEDGTATKPPGNGMPPHAFLTFQRAFTYECPKETDADIRGHAASGQGSGEPQDEPAALVEVPSEEEVPQAVDRTVGFSACPTCGLHPAVGQWKTWVIENLPPRFAKSEYWNRLFIEWRFCLNRSVRIITVSKTWKFAKMYLEAVCRDFEVNRKLLTDWGRFKPLETEGVWRPGTGEADIAGRKEEIKERSLRSCGIQGQLVGIGADWVLGDDIVDLNNQTQLEQRNTNETWVRQEMLSRVEVDEGEGEGHCILIGARVNSDDLYSRLLKTRNDDEEDDEDQIIWDHISFPALYDAETGHASQAKDAISLWPEKWTRSRLMIRRANAGPAVFAASFQQDPGAEEDKLFKAEYFSGSEDPFYPGCFDQDRAIGEAKWPREETVRVVSIDPGESGFTVLCLLDIKPMQKTEENPHVLDDTYQAAIVDLRRRKYMGWDEIKNAVFWWRDQWGPIDFCLFEANGFQKWFLREGDMKEFFRSLDIEVKPHETRANKGDPRLGFKTLAADFAAGRIRLPNAQGESRILTSRFVDEAVNYIGHRKDKTDQLMATWFPKWNIRSLTKKLRVKVEQRGVSRWGVPLRLEKQKW